MLEAQGYPGKPGALMTVANHLSVPHATLSRWARELNNPPPPELVQEKRLDLVAELTELLGLTLAAAKDTVGEATNKELATAIGIYIDKLQLLSGKPTDRQEVNVTDHRERLLAAVTRKSGVYVAGETEGIHRQPVA